VTEPGDPIRILIADDHAAFRSGLAALLETVADLVIVGEAADGDAAVAAAAAVHPDVILMDLTMPGTDGIAATRRIVETSPHVAILVLTMDADDESVLAAVRAGARGYVLKGAQRAELVRAIRSVVAGEAIFGARIAGRLAGYLARAQQPVPAAAFPELTDRERQILDLIAAGHSNAQITSLLVLSPKTVRNHVSNVFAKIGARSRAEAIVRAREAGLGGEGRRPA
jgi:DNA-binding NarL/FixJ family response regulator